MSENAICKHTTAFSSSWASKIVTSSTLEPFQQCYQPGKKEDEDEEIAWINCAEDYHCSAECIRVLGSRFRVKCYAKSDCETLARIHDGGANGCRDSIDPSGYVHNPPVAGLLSSKASAMDSRLLSGSHSDYLNDADKLLRAGKADL
ncbi:Destabilase [Ancylostoma caninum]|uniref:lysozyme n=1 Tax=Ancylostoma caninum TaxID=29170 RepID=A0A368F7S8_ANCCA|nr:Destabilase [Ancylostoma caninum]